jgi:tetratricopeptide (TPR) repeat protein
MPVKTMGIDAPWGDVKEIRKKLLIPAADKIAERLGREVKLVIEDEKKESGHIPTSMFAEASNADIYIADLTGFSANVFLELGVRWAVKDGVTILIAQNAGNLKFNVAYNRAIEYGPMPTQLEDAISDLADYAVSGLTDGVTCDSPVRSNDRFCTISRAEYTHLKTELARLQAQQGEDLVRVADSIEDQPKKIELLRKATEANPGNFTALLKLGILLREAGDYTASEEELRFAVGIDQKSACAWRELGATQSKRHQLSDASNSLRISLGLEPDHSETWRILGGLRRRLSRGPDGAIIDWQELHASHEAYKQAARLDPNDSYGFFNFSLLSLILTIRNGNQIDQIIDDFTTLELLCRLEVKRKPKDPWKRLDWSATLAILEHEQDAMREAETALLLAGNNNQISYVESAIPPLTDLTQVMTEDTPRRRAVLAIINLMQTALSTPR